MSIDLIAYGAFFLTMAFTYAIICLGLNVQWGMTGLFNVGIAAFVAVGAYTSAILTTPDTAERFGGFGLPIAVGWLGAAIVSGALSWAVGALTIRLRSDYLAIATFGVAVTVQLCMLNLQSVTGGAFGIGFIPRPFADLQGNALLFSLANCGLMALVVLVLYLGLQHLSRSPWGRVLRAIREDEVAAQALGKRPVRFRLQAFTVGGAIMGLAGAAQAHFIGFIAPDNYMPVLTFQVWAMLLSAAPATIVVRLPVPFSSGGFGRSRPLPSPPSFRPKSRRAPPPCRSSRSASGSASCSCCVRAACSAR